MVKYILIIVGIICVFFNLWSGFLQQKMTLENIYSSSGWLSFKRLNKARQLAKTDEQKALVQKAFKVHLVSLIFFYLEIAFIICCFITE